eukprot:Amastigsp_a676789_186.p3 type:complete len:105 gc:universal Amastigsp_a676789_186:555-241(-)
MDHHWTLSLVASEIVRCAISRWRMNRCSSWMVLTVSESLMIALSSGEKCSALAISDFCVDSPSVIVNATVLCVTVDILLEKQIACGPGSSAVNESRPSVSRAFS